MSKDEVIGLIQRAFASVTRPPMDDLVHCEQCEIFVDGLLEFCPEHWEEIRSDYVATESSALTAVTPSAWQFLLPAYMIWHVQNYNRSRDSNTVDNVIWNFTWTDSTDAHIADGFRRLAPHQVKAVDAFLAFVESQIEDPLLAIEAAKARKSYWAGAAASSRCESS